ncbi:hypothetical protein K0M31_016771 [Melipona bicolor]|uniref:Uncharacterized protein n=1 Tax=Melipona bicolor TaxID=60889 RepID=A0AA40FE81_9HYME|nr:hypothetical protein K0M31_016771 [Melipona bicolor]
MIKIVTTRFQFPSRYRFSLYTRYSKTKEYRTVCVCSSVNLSDMQFRRCHVIQSDVELNSFTYTNERPGCLASSEICRYSPIARLNIPLVDTPAIYRYTYMYFVTNIALRHR